MSDVGLRARRLTEELEERSDAVTEAEVARAVHEVGEMEAEDDADHMALAQATHELSRLLAAVRIRNEES